MALSPQCADVAELAAIAALMNVAFRGVSSERSWTVESDYMTGERTSEAVLREEVAGGARFLLAKDSVTLALQGCVSLRALTSEAWYLGSLTVDPLLQNTGFGRELLQAAEVYAMQRGARRIEMTVVHVRDSLIAWYERRGYASTGERRPFPYDDTRYGSPLRDDLEFVVLGKGLSSR